MLPPPRTAVVVYLDNNVPDDRSDPETRNFIGVYGNEYDDGWYLLSLDDQGRLLIVPTDRVTHWSDVYDPTWEVFGVEDEF